MNLDEIRLLASNGETEELEFKKSTAQLKSAAETVCGFLNGSGGKVFIGISDNGEILGQEVSDKTKRAIGNEMAKITPYTEINVKYINVQNTNKFIIAIQPTIAANKKPYSYDGRAFLRVETNTIPMPQEYYNYLLSENSHHNNQHWENTTVENITIDDLDHDEILNTIREGILNSRIPEEYATNDIKKALQHFRLMHNEKLTAAAVVLFAKNPDKWFPQCLLKLARFKGVSHLDDFQDNKQVHGNAFKIISEAMTFANRYLPIASYFPKGSIEREDAPLFPIKVLREVFANAVCHRDYSAVGGSISFAIFDDRLEIWSYGLFPPGVSGKELKKLHKSVPRNPKIANILYYRKIIESWGRGINMVINECTKAGHPEPTFMQNSAGIKVILPSKESLGPAITKIQKDEVVLDLSNRQQDIIRFIKKCGKATLSDIMKQYTNPPSKRTLQAELAKLKQLGVLDMQGFGRGSKWILTKKTPKDTKKTQ